MSYTLSTDDHGTRWVAHVDERGEAWDATYAAAGESLVAAVEEYIAAVRDHLTDADLAELRDLVVA